MEIISIVLIKSSRMSEDDFRVDIDECLKICQEKCISCIYKFLDTRIYVPIYRDLSNRDSISWSYSQFEPRGRPECSCDTYTVRCVRTCEDIELCNDEDQPTTLTTGLLVIYRDPSKVVHDVNKSTYDELKYLDD